MTPQKNIIEVDPTEIAPPTGKRFFSAFDQLDQEFTQSFGRPLKITGDSQNNRLHNRPSLGGQAFDVRSKDLSPLEQQFVVKRSKELGLHSLVASGKESWATGPHIHLDKGTGEGTGQFIEIDPSELNAKPDSGGQGARVNNLLTELTAKKPTTPVHPELADQVAAQFEVLKKAGRLDAAEPLRAKLKESGWEVGADYVKPPEGLKTPLWDHQTGGRGATVTGKVDLAPQDPRAQVGQYAREIIEPLVKLTAKTAIASGKMVGIGNPIEGAKELYGLVGAPQVEEYKKAQTLADERGYKDGRAAMGDPEIAAHFTAALIPMFGPMAATAGEQLGHKDIRGFTQSVIMLAAPEIFKAVKAGVPFEQAVATTADRIRPMLGKQLVEPTPVEGSLGTGAKPRVRGLSHERFGQVTVAESQAGVPAGKLKVTDASGAEHIVQNPRTTGNREATFVKPQEAVDGEQGAVPGSLRPEETSSVEVGQVPQAVEAGQVIPEAQTVEPNVIEVAPDELGTPAPVRPEAAAVEPQGATISAMKPPEKPGQVEQTGRPGKNAQPYAFHRTTKDALRGMLAEGMDQGDFTTGSAIDFPGDVTIRVKVGDIPEGQVGEYGKGVEWILPGYEQVDAESGQRERVAIAPEKIEVKVGRRWLPLHEYLGEPAPSEPTQAAKMLPEPVAVEPPKASAPPTPEHVTAKPVGKERALPQTLESAQLEKGQNLTYQPSSILAGAEEGRKVVAEKGVDGAIEHVLRGNAGIEWASTGYAAMEDLRAQEAKLRPSDSVGADAIAAKRLKFVGDFAEEATRKGQAIAGVRAIEEFAPDRAVYEANRLSQKARKRNLSPEEDSRISEIGTRLKVASDRIKTLETALEEAKTQAAKKTRKPVKAPDFQNKLDGQAQIAKASLASRLGKLDLGQLNRPSERGAVTVGDPPLPGDAELVAQYAASRLAKLDTVSALNVELVKEFGPQIEPVLGDVRRRAYALRQEARMAELESTETPTERKRTILQDIQKEITEAKQRAAELEKQSSAQKLQAAKEQRGQADETARVAKIQEGIARDAEKEAAKERLTQTRREYLEASKAQKSTYRAGLKQQRSAERTANLWDTPIRKAAMDARQKLVQDPTANTVDNLVNVAAEKLLPDAGKNVPRMRSILPAKFYADMKAEFPDLVTRKNQGEIYKRAFERVQDMATASREAARLKSASAESRQLWTQLGLDTDAQALLIQRSEALRQQQEARSAMAQEFSRVSRNPFKKAAFEVLSTPRALQSSIDAPLGRQGLFFSITHPIETIRHAVPATWKGYTSLRRGDFHAVVEQLKQHPDYKLAEKAGVDLPGLAGDVDPRIAAEESYQSTWAERLPHVRLSEQGFVHGMNAQRIAVFSKYADLGRAEGYTFENNPKFFKEAAALVNNATGRGNMPDLVKRSTAMLNQVLYSPRLLVSRVRLLNNLLSPVEYMRMDPAMRKIAAKEAFKVTAGLGLIYGTAKMAGAKISADPDDADFGKVVVGKTHYDVTAGEAALVRTIFRIVRGTIKKVGGEQVAEKDNPITIVGHFGRQKLAPVPGSVMNLYYGKDVVGNPASLKFEKPNSLENINQMSQQNQLIRMVQPMIVGDFFDAAQEEGWAGVAQTVPAFAGIGVSSYGPKPTKGLSVGPTMPRYTPPQPTRLHR